MADQDTTTDGVKIEQGQGGGTAQVDTSAEVHQEEDTSELILGKFKSAEDLAEAYKELERKMGDKTPADADQNTEEAPEDSTDKDDPEAKTDETGYGPVVSKAMQDAGVNAEDVQKSFEETGDISAEDYDKLEAAGFPRPMVEAYIRGLKQTVETHNNDVSAQIAEVKAAAGGDEGYGKLQEYIKTSFTVAETEKFNEAVTSGDWGKAKQAVADAKAKMDAEFGNEKAPAAGGKAASVPGFASEAELIEAMSNPRYKTSAAYRDEVQKKLANSPNILPTR